MMIQFGHGRSGGLVVAVALLVAYSAPAGSSVVTPIPSVRIEMPARTSVVLMGQTTRESRIEFPPLESII